MIVQNDGGSGSDAVADTAKSIWEEISLGFGKKSEDAVVNMVKLEAMTGGGKWKSELAGKKGDGRWGLEERTGREEKRWVMVAHKWWPGSWEATGGEKWRGRKEVGDGGYEMVAGRCRSQLEEAVRWWLGFGEWGVRWGGGRLRGEDEMRRGLGRLVG
ncbi:hypothetical protein ACLOJK_019769 [Asimina triloba]